MEYRRQGRFLVEMYIKDHTAVIIAIARFKFHHPPSAVMDFSAKVFIVNNAKSKVPIYTEDLWNSPPDMYPVTPHTPPYIPIMYNRQPDKIMLGKASTFMDDSFRSSLHGNSQQECFTVVALTYNRTEHLPQFVKNFKDFRFLSKIMIVWNNKR